MSTEFGMKGRETVTAWVTKCALTAGIKVVVGQVNHGISSRMLSYGSAYYAHGKDWHRTPEDALARAEEMRKAKITSLRRSIDKLEAMTFIIPQLDSTGDVE